MRCRPPSICMCGRRQGLRRAHRRGWRRASARIAISAAPEKAPGALMARLPKLEFVSSFGVGYDHIDVKYAVEHGITVTNTPEVLNEEVADTALGLLLCTVREFPQAERFLRAGKWLEKGISAEPATLARPHRRHGRHGPHRPGDRAAARRLRGAGGLSQPQSASGRDATSTIRSSSTWRATSTSLLPIMPGGPSTQNIDQRRGARRARPARASSSTWRAARWSTTRR